MVKTIKETETVKVEKTIYVAQDGTRFTDEEQAKLYDSSAKAVIMAKFRNMEKRVTGMENFTFGYSDDTLVFIKMKEEYKNDLIQLLAFCSCLCDSEAKRIQDCKEGEELCIRCYITSESNGSYGFDYISVMGTIEDLKKQFEKDLSAETSEKYMENCKARAEENENHNFNYWKKFTSIFGF